MNCDHRSRHWTYGRRSGRWVGTCAGCGDQVSQPQAPEIARVLQPSGADYGELPEHLTIRGRMAKFDRSAVAGTVRNAIVDWRAKQAKAES